jgi:hypothetical protein
MNDVDAGAINIANFVSATAAQGGARLDLRGGVCISSQVPVANGYVNAAISFGERTAAATFVDHACEFFATQQRSFVLWALTSDIELCNEAERRGGVTKDEDAPAMVVHARIDHVSSLRVHAINATETSIFGDLAERGYAKPGMAWLLQNTNSYNAEGVTWAIVSDGHEPLGVACGYLYETTGGVYYVGTPPETRGRGAGAAVTSWVTNRLFELGATSVALQASTVGFPIYQRLGYGVYDHYRRFTFSRSNPGA